MNARTAAAILALFAVAGCANTRWERGNTSAAETEAILADCAAIARAHTTTVNYPHFYRTRDGRTETMFVPSYFVAPGRDVDSCMRRQGFVRVPVDGPRTASHPGRASARAGAHADASADGKMDSGSRRRFEPTCPG